MDSMRSTSFIYHAAAVFTLNFSYNLVHKTDNRRTILMYILFSLTSLSCAIHFLLLFKPFFFILLLSTSCFFLCRVAKQAGGGFPYYIDSKKVPEVKGSFTLNPEPF